MNKASFILAAAARLSVAAIMFFVLSGVVLAQEKIEKLEKLNKLERIDKTFKAEHKGQFCSNNWSNGDKVSFNDLREVTFASPGSLNVDGGRNGGIKVIGENRSDVLLRACVQAWGDTEETARTIASNIKISTGSTVKADGIEENGWSVSYELRVPHNTNLKLNAHNGGISIKSVEGNMEFATTNGGVSLSEVAGDVRGRTTNGGVSVKLAGNAWKGAGLNVETTNGGVNLVMPENYAANIETGTVNGGFRSNIAALNVAAPDDANRGWNRSKEIKTAINGGGAPIRVTTRNGGINIGSADRQ